MPAFVEGDSAQRVGLWPARLKPSEIQGACGSTDEYSDSLLARTNQSTIPRPPLVTWKNQLEEGPGMGHGIVVDVLVLVAQAADPGGKGEAGRVALDAARTGDQ